MSVKKFVGFKIDEVDLIELDLYAEHLSLSRTEFIRQAVAEKSAKERTSLDNNEGKKRTSESDLVKILTCINSLKEDMKSQDYIKESYIYHAMTNGFRNICAAIIAANPEDEKALRKLIKDTVTWEKLSE